LTRKTTVILAAVGLLALASVDLVDAIMQHRIQRADAVLNCVHSMQGAAPLAVSEADPGYTYEASLDWCNKHLDRAGRNK
jgi:hypothetical protein